MNGFKWYTTKFVKLLQTHFRLNVLGVEEVACFKFTLNLFVTGTLAFSRATEILDCYQIERMFLSNITLWL